MDIVYANEPFPKSVRKSIFLAGPTPRGKRVESWRPWVINYLEMKGFDGHVFTPEPRDGNWRSDYQGQVEWEEEGLNRADLVLFWVPREMNDMPALTTNVEWGVWHDSGKVLYGRPETAERCRYLDYTASRSSLTVFSTRTELCDAALTRLGDGALREDGDATLPLHVWRHPAFQSWLGAQKSAGNHLVRARVQFTFPKTESPFLFGIHAEVWIAAEGRAKVNEMVIGRSDVSHVVLFRRSKSGDPWDTSVVIVREFRTPARTPDGMIHETPGGSSKTEKPPEETALEEITEETGLRIRPERLRRVGARQVAGTLSYHVANVFAVELTWEELYSVRARAGEVMGVEADSERIWASVKTVSEIVTERQLDWSNIGMILSAVCLASGNSLGASPLSGT